MRIKYKGVLTNIGPSKDRIGPQFRRVNDRIFSGPRGSVQRYSASEAASDVVKKPYGGPSGT